MPGTCSGKCCAVFNYPTSPEKLRERAEQWPSTPKNPNDDAFLADMLVSLTPEEAQKRAARFEVNPPDGFDLVSWSEAAPSYTCRHWDEESRLCTAYEARPQMCREYPYAGRCQHDCECDFVCETHIRTKHAALSVQRTVNAERPGRDRT